MRCASLSMNPVGEHRFCSSMEQKLTDRGTSAMKDQKTIDLFLYWNRLRNGRPAPRRHEIEPADIRSLLGDTFILEEDTRGQAIFRLAGTRLCALFGQELKGFVFASLWNDRDRRIVTRLAGNAFRDNCVVVLSLEGLHQPEQALKRCETALDTFINHESLAFHADRLRSILYPENSTGATPTAGMAPMSPGIASR